MKRAGSRSLSAGLDLATEPELAIREAFGSCAGPPDLLSSLSYHAEWPSANVQGDPTMPQDNPRDDTWSLLTQGDSFEREWSAFVMDQFPAYEQFWRRHVVPLSFRPRQPDNQFIRPSLAPHLVGLADASYAVFYHVAHVHAYEQRMLFRKHPQDFPRPTECLYCFFTHAHSAHEALLHFGQAVNRALAHYGQDEVFDIERDAQFGRHLQRLRGSTPPDGACPQVDLEVYQRLQSMLSAYRNLLIHEKPIFMQNLWLPRTAKLDEYAGLTAIGKIARDPDALRRDYREVREAMQEVIFLTKQVAEMVFALAICALDRLGDGYSKDQSHWGDDHRLDRSKFERIRER